MIMVKRDVNESKKPKSKIQKIQRNQPLWHFF